ncbi:exo-beta-N-acetylmuramidase NamZ family protein [Pseudoalteromonas 'SMAR']|uniref:exo-beta-N-acetylmuramidase NamZ family protein n=1 Tax=Pseudoalteromonas 'SMAR' TaxID=3416908 RepID=UPI003AF28C08
MNFRNIFFIIASMLSWNGEALTLGAERTELYLPELKGKRVGLIVNQTSRVGEQHLVDILLQHNIAVRKIFAPEHGFRGKHDAGALIADGKDKKTGLPIISLYGKNKKPSQQQLDDVDILIFDIQDVGLRFYTYISTMHLAMEAAAEANIEFMVLDRPNPNIAYVDGPVLEPQFRSFVGMHPIPVLHGMTVAELAKMIVAQKWLETEQQLKLTLIPMLGYHDQVEYRLPVPPSPNLPNQQAIYLYPSLCFFEATPVSVGRGTEFPFQVYGHSNPKLGDFAFSPRSIIGAAANPKLKGLTAYGQDLRKSRETGFNLHWFVSAYRVFNQAGVEFFTAANFMDKLAGTDKVRKAMLAGANETQLQQLWHQDVADFLQLRQAYLLYPRQ